MVSGLGWQRKLLPPTVTQEVADSSLSAPPLVSGTYMIALPRPSVLHGGAAASTRCLIYLEFNPLLCSIAFEPPENPIRNCDSHLYYRTLMTCDTGMTGFSLFHPAHINVMGRI
jgi:hypothetical protein